MAKSRNVGSTLSDPQDGEDVSAAFVDAVRTQATDELAAVAVEYGILLKDLAIVDRKFKGEIARVMDHLTTRALEAQVESVNLDRENNNRRKKQEGDVRVAELENAKARARADADAYQAVAEAKGRAEATRLAAEAEAEATLLRARATAEAARLAAAADGETRDEFARVQARARLEVLRTQAFGDKAVFVAAELAPVGGAMALANAMEVARR
jgi:membrane protein involved in colicin uptake